jgi:transcriptional regulator with XRE-family HTH domain
MEAASLHPTLPSVGALLRRWREARRLSQMELALDAGVSTRHLSFLENGRAKPSREMVVKLADHLDVPLRERNELLLAAGYAPAYPEGAMDEERMAAVRAAVRQVLAGHEPYPALVVDRYWEMLDANAGVGVLLAGVEPEQLAPPVNVLRLALHPEGMAPRIANLAEWRAHLLDRLGRQVVISGDPALANLYEELAAYPGGGEPSHSPDLAAGEIATPLRIRHGDAELRFISTVTTFGTAIDVTLSELSIEAFFPADAQTAQALYSASS